MPERRRNMDKLVVPTLVTAILALLAGCTPAKYASDGDSDEHHGRAGHEGAEHDEPADPRLQNPDVIAAAAKIRVLPGSLGCTAEVLGLVDVHEPVKSTAEALDALRRRAALVGAEAVVGVEFEHGEGGAEKTHLSGTAVRCNDLLRGRKYDVISRLEVTGTMEHENEALAELERRARVQGANLLLDVHFDHGDGDRTKVSATAVHAYDAADASR
jgi:uncharacterized protein YbjQ (UPF0145 family)